MTKEFDFLIFIGRMQPMHNGHLNVIKAALEKSERLIVLLGSANSPRTIRNPFTFEERKKMIMDSVEEYLNSYIDVRNRLFVLPINDFTYTDALWVEKVQEIVNQEILNHIEGNTPNITLHGLNDVKIGLIGHNKDNSSFYLKLFPQWKNINIKQEELVNATDIRNDYFKYDPPIYPKLDKTKVPNVVFEFLYDFSINNKDYIKIVSEYGFIESYKEQWKDSPYPPVFVTVDAVVVQSGHILLVKRKAAPGEGMLALPGGYIKSDEKLFVSCLRELREESRLKVPEPALKGSLITSEVFDDPHRDARGRIITHAFLFKLEPRKEENYKLPKVKGGDDAAEAFWLPLAEVKEENMYSDHYHIIRSMVGKL